MPRSTRSISLPIILASVTVALAIAMLVGWTLVILQNLSLTKQVAQNTSLLVGGIVSLGLIIAVLVLLSVFLAREAREVLRQNNFIDSVTHELKSPLASLKLCLETLARPELSDEQRRQMHVMMVDSVERLSLFIDDVLEASHLSHGREGVPLQDVALADMVVRCARLVATRYKAGPEAISIDVPRELHVQTDSTALETVLKNLLDNAVKYSSDPPCVDVHAEAAPEGALLIEVRDRGIGVEQRHLKRIFERFYRVPSEAVRSRHGTGLGLFVVSALVKNLGGRIEARSSGPGGGTSMRVRLPRQPGAV